MDSALQTIKMKRKKTIKKPSLEELEEQMSAMSITTEDTDMDIMARMSSTTWQRPITWREPRTKGEEVDQLVMEWYSRLGQPVPPGELIGNELDEMDRKAWSGCMDTPTTDSTDGMWGGEPTKSPEDELGPRPEYGTKEFFGWWRKKTAMENAARAAQGLPPLPTKKEIEAEKAKKASAKAAEKAAATAAKMAEKAAKLAAKEAKAAAKAAGKKKK